LPARTQRLGSSLRRRGYRLSLLDPQEQRARDPRTRAAGEVAILQVEQYYDSARPLADHYVVMSRGEVIKSGAGADMVREDVKSCLAL
jgi:hypothetical protein